MLKQSNKQEDIETFELLYQNNSPALFAYLINHITSREDARDLLVEVFLAALEDKRFSTLLEHQQRAWLWRVTRNKVIDLFRQTGRRQISPFDESADDLFFPEEEEPEHVAMRNEEYADLYRNIRLLTPLQQQILQLRFVHNLPGREIATVLDKKEGTVRMLLSRTLNLLRSMYES
jgi:RNA polymerase sigma factor (sigma-70 family)